MNRILSHDDGFDIYREYISILFLSLKNKTFNNFTKKKLFRGTIIDKKEFERLSELIKKKEEKNEVIFFSKTFLSFSKDINICKGFLNKERIKNKENLLFCFFILEKYDNSIVTNIDVKDNSYFDESVEEVLFLPLTCFLVTKVEEEDKYNNYIFLNTWINIKKRLKKNSKKLSITIRIN